ncbi:hypothetical protein [Salmonella enterica]|nr:hypothetical protein HOU17_gp105 [Salmonella phage Sw2]YP_009816779.1 hypothetical protein HOU65_gp107 [Salmonella phage Seafire]YP_009858108.1 hypothetical protein HWD23_gp056 [Salmonella phage faergetype]QNR52330.1 hypothetical protein Ace_0121 [Escherichia coli phage vB_EcoS_Ace]AXY85063.1 hypothetical protein CPT_Sw2_161 [Salmonella phage Sw2]AZF88019.1 hypothetical protein CPT_Seafire_158 [Salmonella phage Seafire]QIQ61413.1 hypothetical protein faergetype_56 [Salmonella phage faerget
MAMTITLPKIQAKLNLLSIAKINYQDNIGTPNQKAYKDAWLKEAADLAGMAAQYNKELKMEIADDE